MTTVLAPSNQPITRDQLLAHRNLSAQAKLLALWLDGQPRRMYTTTEIGVVLGVHSSHIADAGRELSRQPIGLVVRYTEASRIEWKDPWKPSKKPAPPPSPKDAPQAS